jgi:hypothetical protein
MRSPIRWRAELGWVGFPVFQLLVGGTVLAALVHSLFVAELLFELAFSLFARQTAAVGTVAWHAGFLVFGYIASIALGLAGLFRRRLLGCA